MPVEEEEEYPNVRYDWSYFRQDSRATLGELLEMQDRLEGRRSNNRLQVGCTVRVLKKMAAQGNPPNGRSNESSSSNGSNEEPKGPVIYIDANQQF